MNNNLNKAKSVKNDEFYTQLADIEKELRVQSIIYGANPCHHLI